MKKRIIVCCDGTWNRPGNTDRGKVVKTNVELMFNFIAAEGLDDDNRTIPQRKIYTTGIGSSTYDWKDKYLGGSTGYGIDKKIKDAYAFLCMNYQPGDEIFLFGFSRGAYTVRSLAGLIRNCGILKPEYIQHVDRAYELYRDRNTYSHPESDLMISFRRNFANEDITRIRFLGVWDTVGAMGIPLRSFRFKNKERYKFHDETLSSTVDNAFQAVAVDERRRLFKPVLWKSSEAVKSRNIVQNMEQRWFAGVHSNVGGGYEDTGLSDLALQWLIDKAKAVGLQFNHFKLNPEALGEKRNSYTWMYWLTRPVWRKIRLNEYPNQVIDESVLVRYNNDASYRPANIRHLINSKQIELKFENGFAG